MPASRIAGVIIARNPSRNARHSSAQPGKCWLGNPCRLPITTTIVISEAAINTPGMMPARNSRPTEVSDVTP